MVLIGLLLIALVCLALGLVLASAGWLIGSLAASAAAAWVLWRGRDRIVAAGAAAEPAKSPATPPLASAAPHEAKAVATSAPSRDAAVADTPAASDYARRRADELSGTAQAPAATQAVPAASPAAAETALLDVDVWVIDGRPNYHTAHCGVLLGADSETIPHSQAVEDGFTPCTLCDPDAHPERVAVSAAQQANAAVELAEPGDLRQVLVVDGWPHYHAQGCARLAGVESEPIPFGQAVEDGFTPCPTCQPAVIEPAASPEPEPVPDATAVAEPEQEPVAEPAVAAEAVAGAEPQPTATEPTATEPTATEPTATEPTATEPAAAEAAPAAEAPEPVAEPEPAAAAGAETAGAHADVWVVPGRPRFHQQDCMIIGDQGAVALSYAQAMDDGFKPCSLCEPI